MSCTTSKLRAIKKGLVAETLPVTTEETTNQTPGKSVVLLEGPGGDLRPGMRAQAPEP